jgi:hypothetical protein
MSCMCYEPEGAIEVYWVKLIGNKEGFHLCIRTIFAYITGYF